MVVVPFDRALMAASAKEFVQRMVAAHGVVGWVEGADFRFGAGRAGDMALLHTLGHEQGFSVGVVPDVLLDGQEVRSSRVRCALQLGEVAEAAQLLGRPWSLAGQVVRGAQMGRQLGVPTANLDATSWAGLLPPPEGVFAAFAEVAGVRYAAAVSVGRKLTLAGGVHALLLEAHLLDFSGDLYGQHLQVEFMQRLRGQQKFAGVDALRVQLHEDIAQARRVLAELEKMPG